MTELLGPEYAWSGVDLPGFGDAADVAAYTVSEMVEFVAGGLERLRPERFVLVGHSMSGKVAMTAARWAGEGDKRFRGLEGLVMIASSPPGPEPMSDEKREEMLPGLDGSEPGRRSFAERYIRQNVGRTLAAEVFERAVGDVLRTRPAAWRAWLEGGSREDWAERVGVLDLPALVICGEKDADLGLAAQRAYVLPHLREARLEEIAGAGHLLPMEAPEEMARLVSEFAQRLKRKRAGAVAVEPQYLALMRSERVSAVTRRALLERMAKDGKSYVPAALSMEEFEMLRAVAERVVPQGEGGIDLAAQVDERLARGAGKGWRYADLPADLEAYRGGLAALNKEAGGRYGVTFVELEDADKDAVLGAIVSRALGAGPHRAVEGSDNEGLAGAQMLRWFEDLRAELVGIYVSHPATLARMGYSGIADGARSEAMTGFVELGMGKVEAWEPRAALGGDAGR